MLTRILFRGRVWAVGLGLAAFSAAAFAQTGSYARRDYRYGGNMPMEVVAADFNGDGYLDLATANHHSNNLSILLAYPDGTFESFGHPPTDGEGTTALVAGDLNGDGRIDLAAVNFDTYTVTTFLGNGFGGFPIADRRNFETGAGPHSITMADVNLDGLPDIVVVNDLAGTISVLLGNGDGTLAERVDYQTGSSPHAVQVADVNSDEWPDLVIANLDSNDVSVLLGLGDGLFLSAGNFPVGRGPHGVVVQDLNGDGFLDVATANTESGDVSILDGNGDGTFGEARHFSTGGFPIGVRPAALAAADLNGDGFPDLASTNHGSNTVSILLNSGAGDFSFAEALMVGTLPSSVVVRDFNGDGLLDMAVANSFANSITVLLRRE